METLLFVKSIHANDMQKHEKRRFLSCLFRAISLQETNLRGNPVESR